MRRRLAAYPFFFFNDTATTEIYTLSLHDALPISRTRRDVQPVSDGSENPLHRLTRSIGWRAAASRSEEHTSELQSRLHLVCRLLLEKKKKKTPKHIHPTSWSKSSNTVDCM